MNPLRSLTDYELFIYALPERYTAIEYSTLVLVRIGKASAILHGIIGFENDYRLIVREQTSFEASPGYLETYGYEIWYGSEQLYWYDSQAHPNDATLASTHPHHKHLPPDIKHHRVPAPDLSFTQPNMPFLIEEIINMVGRP